jgi:hypothetical protein
MGQEMRSYMTRTMAALGALLAVGAARADITYEVEAGVGHSDNVTRTDAAQTDDSLASLGLNLNWRERTRRLQGDVVTDVSYVEYLDDTYDAEVIGNANANLVFAIVPETFTWQLQDSFGQARTNPFEPVTPDNRENINYFTTGPDVRFRLGSQMTLQVYGRYTTTDYEESPLDSERTSAGLGLFRDLSAASRVGINAVVDESEFDDAVTPSYERRSTYLSYDLTAGRTQVAAQVGYSEVEIDGQEGDGGALVNIRVTRDLSASSSLMVSASRQFTDAGEALGGMAGGEFGGGAGGGLGGGGELTASGAPYEGTDYAVAWQFEKRRTSVNLGVNWSESDYETQPLLNRKSRSYFGSFGRQLRPTLRLELNMNYLSEEFASATFEAEDFETSLNLDWQMSRRLGLRVSAERYDHDTDSGTGEFVENRYFLYLTYLGGAGAGSAAAGQ